MRSRFFCPFPLAAGATVTLPSAVAHHAINVLKVGVGETAVLFDGRGGEWLATLQPIGTAAKAVLHATLTAFDARDNESPLQVTLVQALPASDKMDWVVQKAVELGVARIQPVLSRRSVVRLAGERAERRLAHWRGIAIAACEQSGRNRVPEIAPILDLPRYLAQSPSAANGAASNPGPRLICAPEATTSLRQRPAPTTPLSLLIGPESGWEDDELRAAQAAGCEPIALGPRVLRAETAGIAALAAVMALWGDL